MPSAPDPAGSDPFHLPSAPTPLARAIADQIRSTGPITFADFMQRALYDPALGYYRSGRPTVGREGDFLTSPELHPVFGYAVAISAASIWDQLRRPPVFDLVDVGPGTGALIAAAAHWIEKQRPDLWRALRITLVELSEAAQAWQGKRLGNLSVPLEWLPELPQGGNLNGLIVANELLDAQPVHRLQWTAEGDWQELFVGLDQEGGFRDEPGAPSHPALLRRLKGVEAAEGQIVEVCALLPGLLVSLSASIGMGALLLFDYGYAHDQLYAPHRREGTLMTFRRHTPGDDPYRWVGEQDITCHIDLDFMLGSTQALGLRALPFRSQAEWLLRIGALDSALPTELGSHLDDQLAQRRALERLTDPAGLGRIQVMGLRAEGVESLPGLEPDES